MWKLVVFFGWTYFWPEPIPHPDQADPHPGIEVTRWYENEEACERMEAWLLNNRDTKPPGETDPHWGVMTAYCHPPEEPGVPIS